ncbi:MAG: hypothetical protein J6K73_09785 [Clostridia bacterium]|nr:hypothetical protein [Clostridia bacterium]
MENNNYLPMQEEETIDLKEMFFYILRKWKIIIALMLVGALLGGLFAISKEDTTTTTNKSTQSYLVTSDFFTVDLIKAKLSAILLDDDTIDAIRQDNDIDLDNEDILKLISIEQTKTATSPQATADSFSGMQIKLTVTSEDAETCQKVASSLDQTILKTSDSFAQEYENYSFEKLNDTTETETTVSAAPSPVKYAVIGAIAMAALAVIGYAVLYLFNGTVKNIDEIRTFFGLYPIAQLADGQKKLGALPVNSKEYLQDALKAMKLDNPLFCGDTTDGKIAELLEWLAGQEEAYATNPALAADGQRRAAEAGSVILIVRLWKTSKEALKREMEICAKLDKKISGVIVLK